MLILCLLPTCTWNIYKVIHWVLMWPFCLYTDQHIKCLHSAASHKGCCLPYRPPGNTYCRHTAILKDFAAPLYKCRFVLSSISTFTFDVVDSRQHRFEVDARFYLKSLVLFGKASWPVPCQNTRQTWELHFKDGISQEPQKGFNSRQIPHKLVYYSQASMNKKIIC